MSDGPYTPCEAVQVRVDGRWLTGTVKGFEGTALANPCVQVEVARGGKMFVYAVFADSPNLRKWRGNERSNRSSTAFKKKERVRYRRVIE